MPPITPELGFNHYIIAGCGRCILYDTPKCKVHRWHEELLILRSLLIDCGLHETIKWGVPCYMFQNSNVVLLSAFKEYCALSFFKGNMLNDKKGLLQKAGENSQVGRLLKIDKTTNLEDLIFEIKNLVLQAIEIEKSGIKPTKVAKVEPIPTELEDAFIQMPELKKAFFNLTPGRQRGYIIHFSQPKQSTTRAGRIQKLITHILNGKGIMDK